MYNEHDKQNEQDSGNSLLHKVNRKPAADLESLYKVFTIPVDPTSTLALIEREISENLDGFLRQHVVALERPLRKIEEHFQEYAIPNDPTLVSDQATFLLDKVVAHSVHTASPKFIGHMATPLPYFMLPLSKIMMALNQNLVKIETSRAFTPLERQVIGMLHHLVYSCDDAFYQQWMHDSMSALGAFCSGGTVANLTALWVARNKLFPAEGNFEGVAKEGLFAACKHYDCEGAVIIVSEMGHYSLSKSADLLGIGRNNILAVKTDSHYRVDLTSLEQTFKKVRQANQRVIALIGVAGSSETGSVDPLDSLADLAAEQDCHFHVDAAWGGPTLCSTQYRHLLAGIERADSVTIDAHKQFYVPMGAGLVVFRESCALNAIEHHADYIIRKGSKDLGSYTLEGSRAGMALLVQSGFKVLGRKGYELLINMGIEKARQFAQMIREAEDFELLSEPELNILAYRFVPSAIQQKMAHCLVENQEGQRQQLNQALNAITNRLQKKQRAYGRSFVSRTTLRPVKYAGDPVVVFRVVLANPLTTQAILQAVLVEQREIASEPDIQQMLAELMLDQKRGEK